MHAAPLLLKLVAFLDSMLSSRRKEENPPGVTNDGYQEAAAANERTNEQTSCTYNLIVRDSRPTGKKR